MHLAAVSRSNLLDAENGKSLSDLSVLAFGQDVEDKSRSHRDVMTLLSLKSVAFPSNYTNMSLFDVPLPVPPPLVHFPRRGILIHAHVENDEVVLGCAEAANSILSQHCSGMETGPRKTKASH